MKSQYPRPRPRLTSWRCALVVCTALLTSSCASTPLVAQPAGVDEPIPIEAGIAPPPGPYAPGFDALHYEIDLTLPDTGSYISGRMQGSFLMVPPREDTLALDLTGLAVTGVRVDGIAAPYRYEVGKIHVGTSPAAAEGDTIHVEVDYEGTPDDGLILKRNMHGTLTAFADNWPNRARFWFPAIDHPSDKATVRFRVRMSSATGRQVISNGAAASSTQQDVWEWSTSEPIPTYTMVVGAAEFVVESLGEVCREGVCTEVTTWLFPPDAQHGAVSFHRAVDMLAYYSDLIAPFPYSKLAHVQSSTRFGGMENVSAIFYPEEPISEGVDIEVTVAHETVHQWFGDAVTESDWSHLWLSEGFASYFAALFFEHADGLAALQRIMTGYFDRYLTSGAWIEPIVRPDRENLFELLNANNYQKGAWVLHMLRHELGDDAFFHGIRAYYHEHRHATALTADLRGAMEAAAGRSLEQFFNQWIYQPGHPILAVEWAPDPEGATLRIRQSQPNGWPVFNAPVEIEFVTEDGAVLRTVDLDARAVERTVSLPSPATEITIDPRGMLLKEVISVETP